MLRKSSKDIRELVEAARQDFIDGAESEVTLRVRLAFLIPKSEVAYQVELAKMARAAGYKPEHDRMISSRRWLDGYLKR